MSLTQHTQHAITKGHGVATTKHALRVHLTIHSPLPPLPFLTPQLVLQLAFYRDQGRVPSTYESATTRPFLHGRTSTVRTQSMVSRRFVQGFDDVNVTSAEKAVLYKAAQKYHRGYVI